jgi:signal transduction histidine kinase
MESMMSPPLERGILTLFRVFVIVQLFVMFINLHVHSARTFLIGNPGLAYLATFTGTALLIAFLSIGIVRQTMGRLFLPVAIIFSASFSLVMDILFLAIPISIHPEGSAENTWQIFLYLYIPLVLVSWQYGVRSVIAFCLFTTALDFVLTLITGFGTYTIGQTYLRLQIMRFFSFMVTGCIISAIMHRFRVQRQELELANTRLAAYAQAIEQLAISRERNRMARELHDTLSHTLSGLAVHLEAVDALWGVNRDKAHDMLKYSIAAVRSGLTETRKAIQALRASPLDELGLAGAIEEVAKDGAQRAGLALNLKSTSSLKNIPEEVEQGFYRICQEAIENCVKHSQAHTLNVSLAEEGPYLTMEIADDGIGFDEHNGKDGKHFGINGMRERANLIHGKLQISSMPGNGTRIILQSKVSPPKGIQ